MRSATGVECLSVAHTDAGGESVMDAETRKEHV